MNANTRTILSLYKEMLRESGKFVNFNYRSYALRRIKDGFRTNSKEVDPAKIENQVRYAQETLKIIKRQTIVGQLFGSNQQLSVEVLKH